jgi:hypothetical protein
MPILGRTPDDCYRQFREHVSDLVSQILPASPHLHLQRQGARLASLHFFAGKPVAVPIDTRDGRVYFYLGQALEVVEQPDATSASEQYRLRTLEYMYRLQTGGEYKSKAFLRWEYDRDSSSTGPCRHHVQMTSTLDLGDGRTLELNKLHVTTGWVLIEEVFRFLIVDLGMKPPCGDRWPEVLQQGELRFFDEFTSKRYVPPEAR